MLATVLSSSHQTERMHRLPAHWMLPRTLVAPMKMRKKRGIRTLALSSTNLTHASLRRMTGLLTTKVLSMSYLPNLETNTTRKGGKEFSEVLKIHWNCLKRRSSDLTKHAGKNRHCLSTSTCSSATGVNSGLTVAVKAPTFLCKSFCGLKVWLGLERLLSYSP